MEKSRRSLASVPGRSEPEEPVTATAGEREAELTPSLEKARRVVAEIGAAIQSAERHSHDAYVRADVPAGDAAQAELANLQDELLSAQGRLSGLETAAYELAAGRQREEQVARLARITAAMQEAGDIATRELADIGPLASALKQVIRRAEQAEGTAGQLDKERHVLATEVHGLGIEANGVRYLPDHATPYRRIAALLESSPALRAIRNDGRY